MHDPNEADPCNSEQLSDVTDSLRLSKDALREHGEYRFTLPFKCPSLLYRTDKKNLPKPSFKNEQILQRLSMFKQMPPKYSIVSEDNVTEPKKREDIELWNGKANGLQDELTLSPLVQLERNDIQVDLHGQYLWQQFDQLHTEMIITNAGR